MPLRDHFHPPLSDRRPWESFHTTWTATIADSLNSGVLPGGYIALEQVHSGPAVEIDVGAFSENELDGIKNGGGTWTAIQAVWTSAIAPIIMPATFPPSCTVEIHTTEGGRTLVAALELVSPANKDPPAKRRLFASKCASYLARGIGLIIVDVVSSRAGNLHNELIDLFGFDSTFQMSESPGQYCAAYRPVRIDGVDKIESWSVALSLGTILRMMPLSLHAELCVPVDLEASYEEACQRRRVDEVH